MKVQIIHDDKPVPNQITSFMHCAKCVDEKPNDLSPRSFASIEVGITDKGFIQVWCKRHELNIDIMNFKVKAK